MTEQTKRILLEELLGKRVKVRIEARPVEIYHGIFSGFDETVIELREWCLNGSNNSETQRREYPSRNQADSTPIYFERRRVLSYEIIPNVEEPEESSEVR